MVRIEIRQINLSSVDDDVLKQSQKIKWKFQQYWCAQMQLTIEKRTDKSFSMHFWKQTIVANERTIKWNQLQSAPYTESFHPMCPSESNIRC